MRIVEVRMRGAPVLCVDGVDFWHLYNRKVAWHTRHENDAILDKLESLCFRAHRFGWGSVPLWLMNWLLAVDQYPIKIAGGDCLEDPYLADYLYHGPQRDGAWWSGGKENTTLLPSERLKGRPHLPTPNPKLGPRKKFRKLEELCGRGAVQMV